MTSHLRASCIIVVVSGVLAVWSIGCSSDDGKPSSSSGSTSSSGSVPDAGPDDAATEGGGALKKNAETCATPAECQSNVCFIGGNQSFCSLKCTIDNAATICVPPFTGTCNKQGFCKRD